MRLKSWSPHLYLNKHDSICNRYIFYFTRRSDDVSSYHNFGSGLFLGLAQTFHLLPRATCCISTAHPETFLAAHTLTNWIDPDSPVNVQDCERIAEIDANKGSGKGKVKLSREHFLLDDTEDEDDSWLKEEDLCKPFEYQKALSTLSPEEGHLLKKTLLLHVILLGLSSKDVDFESDDEEDLSKLDDSESEKGLSLLDDSDNERNLYILDDSEDE
ncbi:hypothetical protein R1flu_026968 [Riccia fluitans]|uniref:Uncharacterized protein n=1 Tax=Riccia fluitans TaxID=41844 RepID=A0ABD1XHY5_9MARC